MTDEGGIFNLRPLPTHCGICFESLGDTRGNLIGGLHLCDRCNSGDLPGRLLKTARLPYWRLNGPGAEAQLAKLGLSPRQTPGR